MGLLAIHQMASFSRAGETLILRALNAHPRLTVVHQVHEPDRHDDLALFRTLKDADVSQISRDDPRLSHRDDLAGVQALILKNAVWEHAYAFSGFILVRNPLAIITSARTMNETSSHREQVRRWGRGIDARMLPFVSTSDATTAFCTLLTRKLIAAHATGLPIVRYEDFVCKPEPVLRRLLAHLEVEWDDSVLRSHERYSIGEFGHGGIKLWEKINTNSLDKYRRLGKINKSKIFSLCYPIFELYGYEFDGDRVNVKECFDDRFKSSTSFGVRSIEVQSTK